MPACLFTMVCGIEMPIIACILAGLFAIFRCLYFMRNRLYGFLPATIVLICMALGALYSAVSLVLLVIKFVKDEND